MDPLTLLLIGFGVWIVTQAVRGGVSPGGWSEAPANAGGGGGLPATSGASLISQIVATLESGGGALASQQPASMVDPVYGQYRAFATQYGTGAVGVDNYAAQVLTHNPGATLGDFYSSYVLSTGNPANLASVSDLQAQYPSAFSNLVNNAGVSPDTPLSSLV